MVNSKKMSKSSIAVIVLSILLVLSLILGFTGAWFTDKKTGEEITKDFGTVELNVAATEFGKVTRVSNAAGEVTGKIMPGDTIGYTLTVTKAEGSEEFWFAVTVSITGLETDITTEITADKDSAVTGNVELTGATYGNTYQGKQVKLSYVVYAVQKANVATAADAVALLKTAVAKA